MGFIFRNNSRVNDTQPIATSLRVQSSVQGQPLPFLHGQQRIAGNLIWYGDFTYSSGSGSGKGGKGGVVGGTSGKGASTGSGANYSASFATGLCEGPVDAILQIWNNKTPQSIAGFYTFDGYQRQGPWTYLASDNPIEAIGYSSLAYTAAANYALGNQPELPNFNYEVRGAISGSVTETYTISSGSNCQFTPTYFNLTSSTTEEIAIPATPYQYQAQNTGAVTALPVVLGNIASANITASNSIGVIDVNGNVYTQTTGSPSAGQFNVTTGGLYTFNSADEGVTVTIIDLAVTYVSYVYQPTSSFSSGASSITVSSAANLVVGMLCTGPGIATATVITGISGTTVDLSLPTTATESSVTLTFWGGALTQVLGTPSQGQFSIDVASAPSYGQITFSTADEGSIVGIFDVVDADPSLSLTDYLTNPRYGIGFPSAFLGSLTALQQWTFANGLFISPAFVQQQSGQDFFNDFSTGLNGEFVWSTGLLTWQPYGDTSVSGYGYTYTAPSSPIYSLGDDDFMKNEGTSSVGVSAFSTEDPVVCVRKRPSDAFNDVKVEYLDRGNSYNPAIVEAQDDAAISAYGLRPADTKTLHFFCSSAAALTSAQLQLGRQMVRNQYTFTVPWYFILLDPMDIIAITDVNLGLNDQWVRILEITENQQDSTLTITAEEFMAGTGNAPLYGTQVKAGYAPNYNVDPGQAIAPIVFEAPVQIATNNGLEIWLLTGGGTNWGGCDVYVSSDNQTYKLAGRYIGSSRIGANNADFPSGSDPDTTDTLQVTLSTSGELYSATNTTQADQGYTLCYEGGYPNPPAPTLSSTSGGSIAATDYYVRITYLFSSGEGPPSPEDSLSIAANNLLSVTSPVAQTGATGWNVYVGTSSGAETKQNSSAIAIGTGWTEPTSGLISGTSPPPSETSYELISYESALLVSGTEYSLGTYIRRGQYGTTISDHPAGSQFGRLDNSQFIMPYDYTQIGQTIYIKLLSFNLWGGGEYTLADVQPFTHVIEGPPLPGTVQNFSATQVGNAVAFSWDDLTDYALKGYDILYGPVDGSVGTAIMLTEAARGTEMTNASVPPGTWIFYIRGHDIANQLGPATTVELVVTNTNDIISQAVQEPTWLGTLSGFYLHYTGVLIPNDQNDAGTYSSYGNLIPTYAASYVTGGSLPFRTYYYYVTIVDSTGETTPLAILHSETILADNLFSLNVSYSATGYSNIPLGINVYIGTGLFSQTLQNATPVPISPGSPAVWTEPTTGLVTGISYPLLDTTGWQVFDEFVPTPVSSASYTAPTIDTGYNDNLRVYSSEASTLGVTNESGLPATLSLSIDTWLTGGSDPSDYVPWTIGFTELRYLNARLTYSNIAAGNVSYITDFTPTVDNSPVIENNGSGGISVIAQFSTTGTVTSGSNQVTSIASMTSIAVGQSITGTGIPAGTTVSAVNVGASSLTLSVNATGGTAGETITFGTWVTFPIPYHTNPSIVVTPVSGSASTGTSGSATNVTPTGFTPLLWNGTTNISGTVNWQSTGD